MAAVQRANKRKPAPASVSVIVNRSKRPQLKRCGGVSPVLSSKLHQLPLHDQKSISSNDFLSDDELLHRPIKDLRYRRIFSPVEGNEHHHYNDLHKPSSDLDFGKSKSTCSDGGLNPFSNREDIPGDVKPKIGGCSDGLEFFAEVVKPASRVPINLFSEKGLDSSTFQNLYSGEKCDGIYECSDLINSHKKGESFDAFRCDGKNGEIEEPNTLISGDGKSEFHNGQEGHPAGKEAEISNAIVSCKGEHINVSPQDHVFGKSTLAVITKSILDVDRDLKSPSQGSPSRKPTSSKKKNGFSTGLLTGQSKSFTIKRYFPYIMEIANTQYANLCPKLEDAFQPKPEEPSEISHIEDIPYNDYKADELRTDEKISNSDILELDVHTRNPQVCTGLCTCLNCVSSRLHRERVLINQLQEMKECCKKLEEMVEASCPQMKNDTK